MAQMTKAERKAHAEDLWNQVASLLSDLEKAIQEIVRTKAWEPLGYSTFFEAYQDRLSHLTLASELRPHIVYQMLDEGRTDLDIALNVKGVGPDTVSALRRQKAHGLAPGFTSVRNHIRKSPPAEPYRISLEIGQSKYRQYLEHFGSEVEMKKFFCKAIDLAFKESKR